MRKMGCFLLIILLILFFFPPSSPNPFQMPLQNSPASVYREDQNDRNKDVVENGLNKKGFGEEIIRRVNRLQGHSGGHGVGGHGGRGHGEGGQGGGAGGGGGVMSHHNNDDKYNKHSRGANSSTTNHIGYLHLAFLLLLPFLFLT